MCHITHTIAANCNHIFSDIDPCSQPKGIDPPQCTDSECVIREARIPGKCSACQAADIELDEQDQLRELQERCRQEFLAQAQTGVRRSDADTELAQALQASLSEAEESRARVEGQHLIVALAASKLDTPSGFTSPQDEEDAIQHLLQQTSEEHAHAQSAAVALGALPDDDSLMREVLMRSMMDWHSLTRENSAMPDLDAGLSVDLEPGGKGKGPRQRDWLPVTMALPPTPAPAASTPAVTIPGSGTGRQQQQQKPQQSAAGTLIPALNKPPPAQPSNRNHITVASSSSSSSRFHPTASARSQPQSEDTHVEFSAIRAQQQVAYEASLVADLERARKKREQNEAQARAETEMKAEAERKPQDVGEGPEADVKRYEKGEKVEDPGQLKAKHLAFLNRFSSQMGSNGTYEREIVYL
ncbi:uncharacterized protein BDR25DRAFT_348033 [Lindgomyces ingoldianus]|uniref:Uncharacterized protein n=1 Tax=Lindgomyces ingoldianus TaxID=673940 RepID=A0ACB6REL4_9PLEO|nr:uncharacterized protein BDR25DRAFT_348033 [Lindgomyces ingoldianus]KAF2477714.1 hypothetical protein BDR25DRAFT_348033 [Lindgomyces ingoldianus]